MDATAHYKQHNIATIKALRKFLKKDYYVLVFDFHGNHQPFAVGIVSQTEMHEYRFSVSSASKYKMPLVTPEEFIDIINSNTKKTPYVMTYGVNDSLCLKQILSKTKN